MCVVGCSFRTGVMSHESRRRRELGPGCWTVKLRSFDCRNNTGERETSRREQQDRAEQNQQFIQ